VAKHGQPGALPVTTMEDANLLAMAAEEVFEQPDEELKIDGVIFTMEGVFQGAFGNMGSPLIRKVVQFAAGTPLAALPRPPAAPATVTQRREYMIDCLRWIRVLYLLLEHLVRSVAYEMDISEEVEEYGLAQWALDQSERWPESMNIAAAKAAALRQMQYLLTHAR
jgi:hypothetical protein